MASPFRFFYKYQKLFIVLAAVTAVFVFVLADMLTNYLQPSGNVQVATSPVANWDGGSLNQGQLKNLVARRHFLSNFLQALYFEGERRTIEEGGTPVDLKVPNFTLRGNIPTRELQHEVIMTQVFVQLAKQSGMTVSDEVINHYLKEFSLHRVGEDDILGLLGRMKGGKAALNERLLFEALREQLLRYQFLSTYASNLQSILPQERWQDWSRLNERIALQAAILPASHFVSKVPEPDDAQLAAFYEEHKEREPGGQYSVWGTFLPSPNPGFKEPRRVRLHYLVGDVNVWREKLLETVTDEEIAEYYERNKRFLFVKASFADAEDATEAEDPAEDGSQEEAADDDSEAEADDDEAVDETPAPETEPASDDTETDAETGAIAKPSPFHLTAFKEDSSEESSETEESEEKESEEKTEENSETTSKTDSEAEPSELSDDEPAAEETAAEETTEAADTEEEPKEYRPLEEVADEIRRQLANEKAVQALDPVMNQKYIELRTVFNKYGGLLVAAKSKEQELPKPPAKLAQLKQAAEQLGLTFEKTRLLSWRELNDEDNTVIVGRARDAQTDRLPVAFTAFSKEVMLYEPSLNKDMDGNWYLVLRVEDVPARMPELKEIRNDVVAAWKRKEAAQLALDQAEILAKEASEASQPFEKFFADKEFKVTTTDLFSWLMSGTTATQGGVRLSDAPPLQAVGPEFMSTAFALESEEAKGVLNFDHTQAYVIRIHSRERTEERLRKLFLTEIGQWYRNDQRGDYMKRARMQANQRQLMEQLTARAGLKFDPDWEESLNQNK